MIWKYMRNGSIMKKIVLLLMGLIAIAAISCVEENFEESSSDNLIITGGFTPDSRTAFIESDGVIETHWVEGDEIGIYHVDYGSKSFAYNYKFNALSGGKSTKFELNDSREWPIKNEDGKTFYAYYPYDPNSSDFSSTVKIPSYIYHNGDFKPFLYSTAKIKDGKLNFQFKHAYAYLKIVISAEDVRKQFAECQNIYDWPGNYNITTEGGYINIEGNGIAAYSGRFYLDEERSDESENFINFINLKCIDEMDLNSDNTYSFMVPIVPVGEETELTANLVFLHSDGKDYNCKSHQYVKSAPIGGFQPGHVYVWDFVDNTKKEKNIDLLQSFYNKTSGDSWHNSDNWFSNKPLDDWYGINQSIVEITHNIKNFTLSNNNLTGPFPEEVADIMDQIDVRFINSTEYYAYERTFDLNNNNLYGPIPDVVKNHKRWNELGWQCIIQNNLNENELDLTNSNLYVENVKVEDLFDDESTVQYLYDIFKENKLTQITGCAFGDKTTVLDNVLETFIDIRVNQHLDYQEKGLHTVYFVANTGTQEEENELKNGLNEIYGEVDGITWLRGKNNNILQYASASYFYDSEGQLVYAIQHNPTCPTSDEEFLVNKCDKFLRSTLGEPVEHPEFSSELYESTDFSEDGKVMKLQEKTVGNGIDLIFMGEAFVDKDMNAGGLYEQVMTEAMEQFFSFEPYKSMRNRFNVYAVKVVSKNSSFIEKADHAIDEDINICFDYAKSITETSNNPPMISVIYRDFTWDTATMGRSYCITYDDGAFVSFINASSGNDGSVLMHESGGHGFAHLLDEYVEYGNEESVLPDERKEHLDNIWTKYGFGANVDWRNDISTVKWSHFLNDSRYYNEGLGLFEGGYLYAYGIYRPSENSMMRYNDSPFNAPSREAIYKRIMQLSEGESWTYDYEEFVKYDEINRNSVTRSTAKSLTEAEMKEYIRNHQPPIFIKRSSLDPIDN